MDALFAWLLGFLSTYRNAAIFWTLFLSGLGLPVPEEITLIIAGYLVHKGYCDINQVLIICFAGILLGDLTIYTLGRFYGKSILNIQYFSKFITRRRLKLAQVYVNRYGSKWVFFARFVMGLRVAVYFSAGTMRMSPIRFVLLDLLGSVVSIIPLVFAGMYFGNEIEKLHQFIEKGKLVILFFFLISLFGYLMYRYSAKKNGSPS